jgi:glutamate synthase domain-containing protein 3
LKRTDKLPAKHFRVLTINARNLHYRILNQAIHQAITKERTRITIDHVCGQRYIGTGLRGSDIQLNIRGLPGNDLASFMDGPRIIVEGNAQDGVGNTMNAGEVIIHGDAGDIVGHSMRGGRIFIKGNVGYRVGIHMKAYQKLFPVIIVGGTARDFLGEYMAGGLLVVLGITKDQAGTPLPPRDIVGDFIATGMHGGSIFLPAGLDARKLGKEVTITEPSFQDMTILKTHLRDFCKYFHLSLEMVLAGPLTKLSPHTRRPYGKIYAY